MAVMFALAGSLMAASLDGHGVRAVGRRLRRLLPALWVLAAVFVPAMLLTGLALDWRLLYWGLPLLDPPANSWGALVLSAIWYLRDYLWFVLLSPLALPLFRRFPIPTLAAPYLLLVLVESGVLPAHPVLSDVGLYFGAWLLGFAHHDGMLRRLSRRVLVACVGVLAAAGAAWLLTHPGPRGYDINDIRLGNALWSAAFILALLGFAPATTAWLERRAGLLRAVTVLNSRALTIYLWHMPIVIGVAAVLPLSMTSRLAVVAALVAVAVALVGWVEDVSARRRPVLLPGGERRRAPVPQTCRSVMSPLPVSRSSRNVPVGELVTPSTFSPEPVRASTR
jgi:peptidoglycan/LPS O-acetylase OafA/YrhL